MKFDFYPLRFRFAAKESLYFPPGKGGNILRGGMGMAFRRMACGPDCKGPDSCNVARSCPYARIFEPAAARGTATDGGSPVPSGLADWPRPFVFRARHLDGRTVKPEELFHFDLHVLTPERELPARLIPAFEALAREGFGPRDGKAELLCVDRLSAGGIPEVRLYEQSGPEIARNVPPVSLDLSPRGGAPARIRVDFLSPTELKHAHRIAPRPEFPVLFGRIRDRISTLRRLYGEGPLELDYPATNARAAAVRMTSCRLRHHTVMRRSSRTGQTHSIGGFVGSAEDEGELGEFLPILEAARWTGVGRQPVWGNGEIAVVTR